MSTDNNMTDNTLELGSSLTIDTIKELQVSFLALAESKKNILLHSQSLETIDLTGIQFLIYANKIAEKNDFEITFDFEVSASSKELMTKTGFIYLLEK